MILANDFSSGLIRFQKLLAQMGNRVLLDLARAVVCLVLLNQVEFDVKFGFLHHFILSVVKSFCQFRDLSGPFVFTL